jgi:hypothetical protein
MLRWDGANNLDPGGLLLSIPELKRTSTTEVDAVSRFIFLLGTFTSSCINPFLLSLGRSAKIIV